MTAAATIAPPAPPAGRGRRFWSGPHGLGDRVERVAVTGEASAVSIDLAEDPYRIDSDPAPHFGPGAESDPAASRSISIDLTGDGHVAVDRGFAFPRRFQDHRGSRPL